MGPDLYREKWAMANRPDPSDVMRAVDTYMQIAYGDRPPPVPVRSQLAVLRSWKGDFFRSPAIAASTDPADAAAPPKRFSIRLGNHQYPHMKLAIERSPDGQTYLFRADAHDAHCCPPEADPEYGAFRAMMDENGRIVQAVEAAWELQGLPTFKTYLKDDLARRQQGGGGATA